MSRLMMFALFLIAVMLQGGAYGLTFMLPRLFQTFGANEKTVGVMLFLTAIATLIAVYYSGHLSDRFGRLRTLAMACFLMMAALALYGNAGGPGVALVLASLFLGIGWGLTYALSPVVLTGLVAPQERVRLFAILSICVMAGFGLSPVLAANLEAMGFSVSDAFTITAGLCGISGLIFFFLKNAVRQHGLNAGGEAKSTLTLSAIARIMGSPARLPVVMVCLGASVFAGMNNFQTVFADERGLDYARYFLTYTITVVAFRAVLARFKGGSNPYLTIAALQFIMAGSVFFFMGIGGNSLAYLLTAFLFGIGYGVSYPILVAMAANDADEDLLAQTLQFFALTYFIGIFGFPLIAGWMIVELGSMPLLALVGILAAIEASMAAKRGMARRAG